MRTTTILIAMTVLLAKTSWAQAPRVPPAPSARPAVLSPAVSTPTLTLFDLELQTVTRAQLRDAILKAGGKVKPSATKPDLDTYDVSAIGLPGMLTLEVVFHRDRFVLATYHARGDGDSDERLRKMLVEKYGPPAFSDRRIPTDKFTERFASDGRYTWSFAAGMQLVYKRTFFGKVDLTYVDPERFDEIKKLATDAENKAVREESLKKSNAF